MRSRSIVSQLPSLFTKESRSLLHEHLDPNVRVHHRLGGRVDCVSDASDSYGRCTHSLRGRTRKVWPCLSPPTATMDCD